MLTSANESLVAASGSSESSTCGLLSEVYEELRAMAGQWMIREPDDITLQPTALVHEAYLRMREQRVDRWQGRTHFLGIAALAMRRVLLDHARHRRAAKRGGGWRRVTLHGLADERAPSEVDLAALEWCA